jgi:medium-chain acyl-[acyl-carrier-protein] hydrolase
LTNRSPHTWEEIYPVRSYDVDARGRLSVISICNFLQDAAGCHAHALGVSIDHLHRLHLTWVLVRMRLELINALAWREQLHVRTWPSHQERLVSQRDFLLQDGTGRDVGRCVTDWVLMDLQRWRPQRLAALPRPLPIPDRPRALTTMPAKIDPPASLTSRRTFRVGDRDLDRNGHVNNVRYVEWALEALPATVRNTCGLKILDINFTGEAFHDETLLVGSQASDSPRLVFLHVVRRQSQGDDLARVKTTWHPLEQ